MNKSDLITAMAEASGINKVQAESALNAFTDSVGKSLKKGEPVTLVGFGTFSVAERSARTGRNPQTGEALKIKAKKLPKFKAGKGLSEIVAKAKMPKK
ncbi:HU family DNA-binding protein [Sphingobacterium sp. KU25419]|nr:HU family DNA-binding protein [Sphingobacterium sp. KU25419]